VWLVSAENRPSSLVHSVATAAASDGDNDVNFNCACFCLCTLHLHGCIWVIELLQGLQWPLHHYRRDRCLSGIWSGTTLH